MNAVLLMLTVLGLSIQEISKKEYQKRVQGGVFSFFAAYAVLATLVFVITGKGSFHFTAAATGYSVAFAVAYCMASIFSFLALKCGPMSLTSLVLSYSLIIPTFYGILVLGEPTDPMLYIGIALLLISLVLINLEGKREEKKITPRWVLFAALAFVGNGACSTIQKMQQTAFDGLYKSEFMIVGLLITAVVLALVAIATERKQMLPNLKKGVICYSACGIANGVVNFLVLVLATAMPASVMFPVISAGGIVLTALVSILLYKEKLSHWQKLGFVLGVAAIVVLNL